MQIFNRSVNTIARGTLLGGLALIALIAVGGLLYVRSPWVTLVGVPIEQPIPFSHKHHVMDDGIDCRYCHTTVDMSPWPGMPDTKTCMNCHQQIYAETPMLAPVRQSWETGTAIQWNMVNHLPDYVYFNHEVHVNNGIGCSSCHGQVDQMPLMEKAQTLQMSFCLECHMHPYKYVRPKDQVYNLEYQYPANQDVVGAQLVKQYNIQSKISCSDCHR
jgi:hypothetical protein